MSNPLSYFLPCFRPPPLPKGQLLTTKVASPHPKPSKTSGTNMEKEDCLGQAKTCTLRGTPRTYALKTRGLWPTILKLDNYKGTEGLQGEPMGL